MPDVSPLIIKKSLPKFVDIKAGPVAPSPVHDWPHTCRPYQLLTLCSWSVLGALTHIILLLYYRLPSSGGWLAHVSGSESMLLLHPIGFSWLVHTAEPAGWAHSHRRGWRSRQAWRALVIRWWVLHMPLLGMSYGPAPMRARHPVA